MINWPRAIERNRAALLRIVEALFAMTGLSTDLVLWPDPRMPRHLHNHILRILRAAESAVRRLIVIAARDFVVVVAPTRHKQPTTTSTTTTTSADPSPGSNPLLDPRKRFGFRPRRRRAKSFPRICVIGVSEPRPIPEIRIPTPDDAMDATRLCRRLAGLKRALDDLPDRPSVSPAGKPGAISASTEANMSRRCAPATRPAAASGRFTKSTTSSSNATGWRWNGRTRLRAASERAHAPHAP